ncbi:phosphotransferase family protein [Gorillibacterium massiliense]|uniref:phosphotransferase family protein n=1 Tax=Gorillibacterium massiliense TaxID=1280390 RepID=UPI0004B98419|nr:phosphotransferase [Gorillibacterium massiliense]
MNKPLFEPSVITNEQFNLMNIPEREIIYTTPGGKQVVRFALGTGEKKRSYIYKPLTNLELAGREDWVYRHLLPHLQLRYPRMLAQSAERDPESRWAIFEDVGEQSHHHPTDILIQAAEDIQQLHRIPVTMLNQSFSAQKPSLSEVADQVIVHNDRLAALLVQLGMPSAVVDGLTRLMNAGLSDFADETVICHGDLHLGNIGEFNGQAVILDWEHVHANSVYWDLFNLLDMTHPDFRRQTAPETRASVLEAYLTVRRKEEGWSGSSRDFIRHYYLFAALYSAWMLLLIDSDLTAGRWNREGLLAQQEETFSALESCAYPLLDHNY